MDERNRKQRPLISLVPAVIITVTALCLSILFLRNLGFLIGLFVKSGAGSKFDFVQIFNQTKDAHLTVHFPIPLFCGIAFYFTYTKMITNIKSTPLRVASSIIIGVLLFTIALVACIALTRVNGIRFWQLLDKLLPLMDKL